MQLTSDWVVTSQLNSAKEAAQELTVKVAGVSKARQLRGWIYLAARFHLSVMDFLEELGSCSLSTECSRTCEVLLLPLACWSLCSVFGYCC